MIAFFDGRRVGKSIICKGKAEEYDFICAYKKGKVEAGEITNGDDVIFKKTIFDVEVSTPKGEELFKRISESAVNYCRWFV